MLESQVGCTLLTPTATAGLVPRAWSAAPICCVTFQLANSTRCSHTSSSPVFYFFQSAYQNILLYACYVLNINFPKLACSLSCACANHTSCEQWLRPVVNAQHVSVNKHPKTQRAFSDSFTRVRPDTAGPKPTPTAPEPSEPAVGPLSSGLEPAERNHADPRPSPHLLGQTGPQTPAPC